MEKQNGYRSFCPCDKHGNLDSYYEEVIRRQQLLGWHLISKNNLVSSRGVEWVFVHYGPYHEDDKWHPDYKDFA